MLREAEKQFVSSLKHVRVVETYAYLAKVYLHLLSHGCNEQLEVYMRLDQPLSAIDRFKEGLEQFPEEITLLTGLARTYEVSS